MKNTKKILALLLALILVTGLVACKSDAGSSSSSSKEVVSDQTVSELPKISMNIAYLKGPTALGMVHLMDSWDTFSNYGFEQFGSPDEVVAKITSGEVDIAAVPTNLAATLYNKTDGKVQIAALNTLGVLYIVSNGEKVEKIADLKGKTLAASGQGTAAEYALNYILNAGKLKPGKDVKIEYKAEHSELAAQLISGNVKLAMLPEPFVTQVTAKNSDVKVALDLTEEWNTAAEGKSDLTMGCIIVRKEFVEKNKEAFDHFLEEYKASAAAASDAVKTGELSEKFNILPADVVQAAVPRCNITFVEGDTMKTSVTNFLNVLFDANPKSIGGKMPGEDFFYKR